MLADFAGPLSGLTLASGQLELYPHAAFFTAVGAVAQGLQLGFGSDPARNTMIEVFSIGMGKYSEVQLYPVLGPTYSRIGGMFVKKGTGEYARNYS